MFITAHLRQPEVFLSTREEWNFSLWSSSKVELLHPEWGMITVLVRVAKASRIMVIFTASQDDKFHSTPARRSARRKTGEQRHSSSDFYKRLLIHPWTDYTQTRAHTRTHTHSEPILVSMKTPQGLTLSIWISSKTNTPRVGARFLKGNKHSGAPCGTSAAF